MSDQKQATALEPHTPGPWVYTAKQAGDITHVSIGLRKVEYGDGITGSRGSDYLHISGIGRAADAALVAMAPNLLGELIRMVTYYKPGETRPEAIGKIRDAEQVIAEATRITKEVASD